MALYTFMCSITNICAYFDWLAKTGQSVSLCIFWRCLGTSVTLSGNQPEHDHARFADTVQWKCTLSIWTLKEIVKKLVLNKDKPRKHPKNIWLNFCGAETNNYLQREVLAMAEHRPRETQVQIAVVPQSLMLGLGQVTVPQFNPYLSLTCEDKVGGYA